MSSAERKAGGTLLVKWANRGGRPQWTNLECDKLGEDGIPSFLRCLLCPEFQTAIENSGIKDEGLVIDMFRDLDPREIWDYKPPTP